MTGTPDFAELEELVWEALRGAVDDEHGRVDQAMNRAFEQGYAVVWAVCSGLASIARHIVKDGHTEDDLVCLAVQDVHTGEATSIDRTGAPPCIIAAARIIAATCNRDSSTAHDLFLVSWADGEGSDTAAAILMMTAALTRGHTS